jgi:Na+/proline symporter
VVGGILSAIIAGLFCPRMTPRQAVGNTQTMTGVPEPTLYHRWLGWHAPAMRRAMTVLIAGLIVAVVLLPFVTWGLALATGWDAAALTFLLAAWPIIIRADSSHAPQRASASQARDSDLKGHLPQPGPGKP